MTDTKEAALDTGGVRLPRDMPATWAPDEIVYTRYTYDKNAPDGHKVAPTIRGYAVGDTDIKRFVEARVKDLPLPPGGAFRRWSAANPEPDRAINIYVTDPCWVVIELDRNIDWQFEPGQPGIVSKHQYDRNNGGLRHVMADGTLADDNGPTGDGCRIIYFGVGRRKDVEHQKFRCNVSLGAKRLDDPDQVDPDIPNDGGRFPFPMVNDEEK